MAYQLGQGFVMMRASRRGGDLDAWLTQAQHSGLASIQKDGEWDLPRLCSGQSCVFEHVESGSGRSAGQLLEAKAPDRVRQGELRFIAASRSLSRLIFPVTIYL